MSMLEGYYADIGVRIQQDALGQVDKYLGEIKSKFNSFRQEMSKTTSIPVEVKVDLERSRGAIEGGLKSLSKGLQVSVEGLTLPKGALTGDSQSLFSTPIQVPVVIDPAHLLKIRSDVEKALQGITFSPTAKGVTQKGVLHDIPRRKDSDSKVGNVMVVQAIQSVKKSVDDMSRRMVSTMKSESPRRGPRTAYGTGSMLRWFGDSSGFKGHKTQRMTPMPSSGRRFSPWYNPMMLGGGMGALLRYGAFSLPFVGGAMGLNTISNIIAQMEDAMALVTSASASPSVASENIEFLKDLGDRLGFKWSDVGAEYSKFIANADVSMGLDKEHLNDYFASIAELAAVNRVDVGSLTDIFSEVMGRGSLTTRDLNSLSKMIPNIRQLVADSLTGGDREALERQVKGSGGLRLTGENAHNLIIDLGNIAQRDLPGFYETLGAQRGRAGAANLTFMEYFMGGMDDAMSNFYRTWAHINKDSRGFAETIGKIAGTAINSISAVLMGFQELKEWLSGQAGEGNFMKDIFGDVADSAVIEALKDTFSSLRGIVEELTPLVSTLFGTMLDMAKGVVGVVSSIIRGLTRAIELAVFTSKYGITGGSYLIDLWEAREKGTEEAFKKAHPDPGLYGLSEEEIERRKRQEEASKTDIPKYFYSEGTGSVPQYREGPPEAAQAPVITPPTPKIPANRYGQQDVLNALKASHRVMQRSFGDNSIIVRAMESLYRNVVVGDPAGVRGGRTQVPTLAPITVVPEGQLPTEFGAASPQYNEINLNVTVGGELRVDSDGVFSGEFQDNLRDGIEQTAKQTLMDMLAPSLTPAASIAR